MSVLLFLLVMFYIIPMAWVLSDPNTVRDAGGRSKAIAWSLAWPIVMIVQIAEVYKK